MRKFDPNTGLPILTKAEWHAGLTPDDVETIAILKLGAFLLAVFFLCIVVLVVTLVKANTPMIL